VYVPLDIDRELSCPRAAEFGAFAAKHPEGAMPYGMARLADAELEVLAAWLAEGAPALPPPAVPLDTATAAQVAVLPHR
jgi:hypothetical protein